MKPDHLHLFVSANPMIPAHKIVKAFKGRSSRILRREFPELLKLPSLWTRSYFVTAAGNVSAETIQNYIEAQQEMILQKTVKAKLFALTRVKEQKISQEHWNFQKALHGEDVPLYSATKQQAQRKKKWKGSIEYPLVLRRDCFKVKDLGLKLSKWWVKIPVFGGSIWCPIQFPHMQEPLLKEDLRETKLVRRKHEWFLHITVRQEKTVNTPSASIIAVDFGERYIATSVEWQDGFKNPKFYGTEVRGIRRHYAWLRKRLGNKKALKTIKKIGHKENRKVNSVLHKISGTIVNRAKELNAVILLGSPNGESMRKNAKGKRFRRIVYSMPYYRLAQFIEYKAFSEGIHVVHANEDYTSKICSKCGESAKRPRQDLIICPHGHRLNADINACQNLIKRFLDHWLRDGAVLTLPKTSSTSNLNSMMKEESHDFNREECQLKSLQTV